MKNDTVSKARVATRSAAAREVWALMNDLVFANVRRREVSEALGLSFARIRAVRRVAERSMAMSELAVSLTIDRPNATTLVDELEALGLVRRKPHPTDRRTKLVEATRKGKAAARKANEILMAPPQSLESLSSHDLETVRIILKQAVDD